MDSTAHTLILLRHGKSDWSGSEPDLRRPLAKRGRRQAPEAGRWLADNAGDIDLALVSPATRTLETWRLASAELDVTPPQRNDDRLYAASGDVLLDLVREQRVDARTVIVVGHNPGLEELASSLTGQEVLMPTSALAVIRLAGDWETAGAVEADLRASGRPPEGAPSQALARPRRLG
jgi:phosphohistidine phosphatase